MTDFWIWREERGFKMFTAKQSSAPRHAEIHLQERPESMAFGQGVSRRLPCSKGGEVKRGMA